jgi:hypothetical protein
MTFGEIGLLTMPFLWDDWADEWLMIIVVRKIIPKTAKVMMIALFINNVLRLKTNFNNISKINIFLIVRVI